MRRSGLAHLLSISGLHVAAVVGAAMLLTMRLLALSPRLALRWPLPLLAALAGAVAGIGYTLLSGAQVPTVRSCIAALIVLAGLALGREAMTLRLVAVGALLILLVRPDAAAGPSFQLSFAAATAIIALHDGKVMRRWTGRRDEGWPRRGLRTIASLLVTGLAVEIALMPIAVFYFHRAGLYGAIANIIAIPLTTFVVMPLEALALLFDLAGFGAPFWWLTGQALGLSPRACAPCRGAAGRGRGDADHAARGLWLDAGGRALADAVAHALPPGRPRAARGRRDLGAGNPATRSADHRRWATSRDPRQRRQRRAAAAARGRLCSRHAQRKCRYRPGAIRRADRHADRRALQSGPVRDRATARRPAMAGAGDAQPRFRRRPATRDSMPQGGYRRFGSTSASVMQTALAEGRSRPAHPHRRPGDQPGASLEVDSVADHLGQHPWASSDAAARPAGPGSGPDRPGSAADHRRRWRDRAGPSGPRAGNTSE